MEWTKKKQNKIKIKAKEQQQQMQIGCQGQIIYTILYNFFYTRKAKEKQKTSNCNELNGKRNKYLWLRLNIYNDKWLSFI